MPLLVGITRFCDLRSCSRSSIRSLLLVERIDFLAQDAGAQQRVQGHRVLRLDGFELQAGDVRHAAGGAGEVAPDDDGLDGGGDVAALEREFRARADAQRLWMGESARRRG